MRDHAKVFFKFFRICAIFGFVFAWAFLPLTDYLTIRIGGVRVSLSPKIEQAYAAYPAVASYEEGTSGGSTSNSLTLTKPSGVQAGDLLIIIVGNDDDSNFAQWDNTDLKPSGFTLINESGSAVPDCHTAAFYRIADGSEGDTISVPAQSSDEYYGWYIRVTGADTNNPINAVGSDVNTSSATSVDITGVTTTVAETLVFYTACFDGADGEPFTVTGTDWSKSDEAVSGTSGTQASGSWGTKQQATAGSTGTVNIDATGSTSDGWSGFQFAVAPFAGQPITVSGTLYSDQGLSAIDCSASSHTVRVLVNGAGDYTGTCTENTGAYSVSDVEISSPGDVVTVFIDGHSTNKGTVVTRAADTTSAITADIYTDTVIVSHEDAGPITNTNLGQYDSGDDADIQFSVTTGNLTISDGAKLLVWTGKTFTPGGTVSVEGDLIVEGNFVGNTNVTVKGNVIGDGVIDVGNELTWTQATSSADWSARAGHSSVVFDNKMWVIGGEDQNGTTNDVWYSTNGTTWTQATSSADWSARAGHSSVVFDNKMWVIGGGTNDVWYSTDGANWTQATNDAPWDARAHHTSVVFDNKIWILGGWNNGSTSLNDVWYSTDGANWTQATGNASWSARDRFSAVVFDGKIWVIGPDDVWYSTDGANWTQATGSPAWDEREDHTTVAFNDKMWIMGGAGEESLNDVWYSTDGANWTQATDDADWSARIGHSSVVFDNKMWVIGGSPDGLAFFDDVWFLTSSVFTVQGSGNFGGDSNWFFDELILGGSSEDESGWYSTSWSNRKKITIDNTQVSGSEDLIDFPVLIEFELDTDLASDAQDDGDDILFTSSDGTTKLSHEIEKFDGNTGELVAWVKIPILSYDTDTEIYMYYGNGSAANQEDAENVWSNGYGAVWHFYDDGNGSLSALDSTSNNNDGMVNGADFMDAGFGGSAYFNVNDSSDHVLVSHDNSISNLNSMTVSARVILASYGANNAGRIFDKNTSERDYLFFVTGDGFVWSANRWDNNRGEWKANSTLGLGEWHYLTVTYDYSSPSSEPLFYVNGSLITNVTRIQTPSGVLNLSTDDLYIGNTSSSNRSFDGLIDEVRILNRELTDDWIATEYNNLSEPDGFYSVENEEEFAEEEPSSTETTAVGSGSVTAAILMIETNHSLDTGSKEWTIIGNGSPLIINGSLNTATSTINFESANTFGTTIPAITYYNLTFNGPGNTFTVAPGTFKTNNNLTVTDGILDLDTNDPTTTVTGDAVISGTLLASDSSAFTIKGDLTMNGDFVHNNGTVVLDPIDSSATVSGTADNITFYNLTSTTRSKTLQFRAYNNSGDEISIEGNLIITGQDGYPIMVRSDSPGTQWKINFSGSSNINYALLRDCGCDVGSGSIFLGQNVYNSGNNGGCWLIIQRSTGSVSISPDSGGGGTPQTGGGQGEGSGSTEDGSGGGTPETGGTPGGGGGTPSP